MLHFWAVIIKTICPYTNYVKNKTKMFIFNLFSSAFLIFNFLRFLPCILLQRLFYYGSEAIEWFILLNYCVNPFDFSLETYLDLVLTQKNRTKLSFIQCTVLLGLVYWREILPLLHLLSGRLHFSKLLKDPYPKTSTNFPTTSSSSSPAKVLQAPDCYQLEHFEDQTIYLFFLVTNQIRELRAVAVIG